MQGWHHLLEQEEPQPPKPVPTAPGGRLSTDLAECEYKMQWVESIYFSELGEATLSCCDTKL